MEIGTKGTVLVTGGPSEGSVLRASTIKYKTREKEDRRNDWVAVVKKENRMGEREVVSEVTRRGNRGNGGVAEK